MADFIACQGHEPARRHPNRRSRRPRRSNVMPQKYDGLRSISWRVREARRGDGDPRRRLESSRSDADRDAPPELIDKPQPLFDEILQAYPKGFPRAQPSGRLARAHGDRARAAAGTPKMEIVRLAAQRLKGAPPIPPKEVATTSPVMENIMRDNEVDLMAFPVLESHREDGGRYIEDRLHLPQSRSGNRLRQHGHLPGCRCDNLLGIWQGQASRAA